MYKFKDDFSGKSATICDVEFEGNAGAVLGIHHPGLDKFVESGLLIKIEDPREINRLLSSAHQESIAQKVVSSPTVTPPSEGNTNFSLEQEMSSQLKQASKIIDDLSKQTS
jgi:hypothetical protein